MNKWASRVYIVGVVGISRVKIGFCGNAMQVPLRLKALQCGCPLELKHLVDAPAKERLGEREIHRKFWECHSHGEWFNLCPELRNFIEEMKSWEDAVIGRETPPLRNGTVESERKMRLHLRKHFPHPYDNLTLKEIA